MSRRSDRLALLDSERRLPILSYDSTNYANVAYDSLTYKMASATITDQMTSLSSYVQTMSATLWCVASPHSSVQLFALATAAVANSADFRKLLKTCCFRLTFNVY